MENQEFREYMNYHCNGVNNIIDIPMEYRYVEIPKEFEEHFKQDRFEDTLHRLSSDAHLIAGNYE